MSVFTAGADSQTCVWTTSAGTWWSFSLSALTQPSNKPSATSSRCRRSWRSSTEGRWGRRQGGWAVPWAGLSWIFTTCLKRKRQTENGVSTLSPLIHLAVCFVKKRTRRQLWWLPLSGLQASPVSVTTCRPVDFTKDRVCLCVFVCVTIEPLLAHNTYIWV